jgi:hypothetical protein
MEQFNKLGAEVEKVWRKTNYSEDEFPKIAADALKSANLPSKVTAWEVIDWTLKQNQLPEQKDLRGNFGDPPITIYNSPRFHIDVYFWLEGTTAIHQHGFCGAFQVLHGSSIHSWYEFDLHQSVNTFTEIGEINLKLCELLSVGDVQQILAGRQYIHGLFHLEQPSATIVVRTHKSPLHLPQYSYHKPFLAIDPFFEEANSIKKNQCLTALFRSNHPETDRMVADLLEESDFQTSYSILTTVRHYLQQGHMNQMFNLDAPKNRFEGFLDVVREKHGEIAEIFPKVFAHQDIVNEIVKRRGFVNAPEHRFFLALLMNVEGKRRIFGLIKEKYPAADPIEKILDWTLDLAQTRVLGQNIQNALGIEDFGDLDLFILECFLKERSDVQIAAAFQAEYPNERFEDSAQKIAEKSESIRNSVIFQPLLS